MEIGKLLLKKGAYVCSGGKYGTALRSAYFKEWNKVVKMLLKHEVDYNFRRKKPGTPLIDAVRVLRVRREKSLFGFCLRAGLMFTLNMGNLEGPWTWQHIITMMD